MKTAIITGASSGIGKAISKSILSLGYKVYGFGRDFTKCDIVDNNFIPVHCDLLNLNVLTNKIKEILKKEDVFILINNAGVGYFGPHEELNAKKIHEIVTINLEVPLLLSQLLLRTLKRNKGFIINISSIEAKKSSVYGCAYGATKAALSDFSNSLFEETRKSGVKIITIHPDMTSTNFYRNANFKEDVAFDCHLCPEEIADAINYILSAREGIVITDITLRPQKNKICRK